MVDSRRSGIFATLAPSSESKRQPHTATSPTLQHYRFDIVLGLGSGVRQVQFQVADPLPSFELLSSFGNAKDHVFSTAFVAAKAVIPAMGSRKVNWPKTRPVLPLTSRILGAADFDQHLTAAPNLSWSSAGPPAAGDVDQPGEGVVVAGAGRTGPGRPGKTTRGSAAGSLN
ncbi:hypothetical protein AB0C74_39305 [Spirillospora sp. NPDC048832]